MNVILLPPSDKELEETIEFYNEQLNGLGDQFLNEIDRAVDLIKRFPNAWSKVGGNTRKYILKRFPYLVLYIAEEKTIIITCIAHQHRDPEYYISRIV